MRGSNGSLPPGFYIKDARHMDEVQDGSVTLVVTSPPYNVDLDYERGQSFEDWLSLMRDVMRECDRKLVDGGRACFNVANTGRNPYIPLIKHLMNIAMDEIGWKMRGIVIWMKGVAMSSTGWGSWMSATGPTFRDNHEYILVFNKGSTFILPDRKNTGITKEEYLEFSKAEWAFAPESATRVGHPAPFPDELPRRCILFLSAIGDVVLDPFAGSGTTYKVARAYDRKPYSYEINDEYIDMISSRVDDPINIQSDAWKKHHELETTYPELANLSTRELVKRARKSGVKVHASMTTLDLIEAISASAKSRHLEDYLDQDAAFGK